MLVRGVLNQLAGTPFLKTEILMRRVSSGADNLSA